GRADHLDPPGARGGRRSGRAAPQAQHLARDLLSLEAEVRRHERLGCTAAEAARGRERSPEADRRGSGAESPGAEGRPGKTVVTPEQRRAVVAYAVQSAAIPERTACRYLAVHRSLVRYESKRAPDLELRERLRTLAAERPRWGSPRLTWLLRREG